MQLIHRQPCGRTLDLKDLSAGNYSVCVTVDGVSSSEFERCFEINISEPDPLGADAMADESNEMVTYTLQEETFIILFTTEDKSNF